jgi:hypothetical protein
VEIELLFDLLEIDVRCMLRLLLEDVKKLVKFFFLGDSRVDFDKGYISLILLAPSILIDEVFYLYRSLLP